MKQSRKWMLVTVCAVLGAAALCYMTSLVLYHINWGAALGLKSFDFVSQDAAVAYLVLGFILGVGLTLGAVGGVLVGLLLERRLPPTGGRWPNR